MTCSDRSLSVDDVRRLWTSYRYPGYPATDLVICSSVERPYLEFDARLNTFCHASAPAIPPRVVIYMIPGNPGLVELYQLFVSSLCSYLGGSGLGSCEVVCSSHLGHSLRNSSNRDLRFLRNFDFWGSQASTDGPGGGSVRDHVEYHCKLVGQMLDDGKIDGRDTKVVVIGHSVGAYIATKVLERHHDRVLHLIGLFPTISHIGRSVNGRQLGRFFSPVLLPFVNMVQLVASLILPQLLLCQLVKFVFGRSAAKAEQRNNELEKEENNNNNNNRELVQSEINLITALRFICNVNVVSAVLRMARSEMESIGALDGEMVRKFSRRLTLCWTDFGGDGWVGESEVADILEVFERCRAEEDQVTSDQVQELESDLNVPSDQFGITNHASVSSHSLSQPGDSVGVPQWIRCPKGIPHAFSLEHNQVMAKRCSKWVEDILSSNKS